MLSMMPAVTMAPAHLYPSDRNFGIDFRKVRLSRSPHGLRTLGILVTAHLLAEKIRTVLLTSQ